MRSSTNIKLLSEKSGVPIKDVESVLSAFSEQFISHLWEKDKYNLLDLVELTSEMRPAQKSKKILNPFTGKEQETKPRAERIRLKAKASDKLVAELGVFVPVVDDDLEEDVKSELNTLISYRKIKSNDFSIFALEEAGLDLETLGLLVTNSKNIFELYGELLENKKGNSNIDYFTSMVNDRDKDIKQDIDEAREILGLGKLPWGSKSKFEIG